eukprot:365224-Chlamydomonas_euryale.AAC.12
MTRHHTSDAPTATLSPTPPHLSSWSIKSNAACDARCWLADVTKRCHGTRGLMPHSCLSLGSRSTPYLVQYAYRSSVPSTCAAHGKGG